jgi:hypothetical protein
LRQPSRILRLSHPSARLRKIVACRNDFFGRCRLTYRNRRHSRRSRFCLPVGSFWPPSLRSLRSPKKAYTPCRPTRSVPSSNPSPDFPRIVRETAPIRAGLGLDTRLIFYKKSLLLLLFGRIAQRESVPFTRERSKVRSLVRPPDFQPILLRGGVSSRLRAVSARRKTVSRLVDPSWVPRLRSCLV